MKKIIPLFSLLLILSCQKKNTGEKKILNIRLENRVSSFDPLYANEFYVAQEVAKVFEGLLEFDYKKRPYELIPNLAVKMPEVSQDGLTYTFTIHSGVKFHPDKCFKNENERELSASDVAFTIKRMADPKSNASGWWMLDGKIAGLNQWRAQKKHDYNTEIDGIKVLGKDKITFKLVKPFPQFLYTFAMPISYIVSEKIVNCYKDETLNHPIGTGAYYLKSFIPDSKYHYFRYEEYVDKTGGGLPKIDEVISHVMVEDQPGWLKVMKGQIDFLELKNTHYYSAVDEKHQLKAELANLKMSLHQNAQIDVTYNGFNLSDPALKNKKLRQALSLSIDRKKYNDLFYKGQGVVAQGPIPPKIKGYEEDFKNPYTVYDVERAKKMIKEEGLVGKKLTFEILSDTQSRQRAEFLAAQFEKIGIKLNISINTWPELVKKTNNASAQIFDLSWYADYPDAENFLQLFYGPNKSPGSNNANYQNPEFDKLFEKATVMQDSPERSQLYAQMNHILAEDTPWIFGFHRMNFVLTHAWLKNYQVSNFFFGYEKYLDIDLEQKSKILPRL